MLLAQSAIVTSRVCLVKGSVVDGGTFPTSKSTPAGSGIEPNQTSSEGVVAKQGNTGSNTSAEPTTPSNAIDGTSANDEEKEEWTQINRKTKRQKRNERKIRQVQLLEPLQRETPYFPKVFNIKFPGVNIDTELNVIEADLDIKKKIGKLKITRAGRSALLVGTWDSAQTEKLKNVKTLAGELVVIDEHKHYNTVKGVVRSRAMTVCSEDQIKEHLREQGVTELQRVKIKRDGELLQTNTFILTFQKNDLPRIIKLSEWHSELVEEYKPKPQQCFNCLKYGHVAKFCRKENANCMKCGIEGHNSAECVNRVKCYHCEGPHWATNKTCRKYYIESEIMVTASKLKTTRTEATDIILSRYPEEAKMYSEAARKEKENSWEREGKSNAQGEGRQPEWTINIERHTTPENEEQTDRTTNNCNEVEVQNKALMSASPQRENASEKENRKRRQTEDGKTPENKTNKKIHKEKETCARAVAETPYPQMAEEKERSTQGSEEGRPKTNREQN